MSKRHMIITFSLEYVFTPLISQEKLVHSAAEEGSVLDGLVGDLTFARSLQLQRLKFWNINLILIQ